MRVTLPVLTLLLAVHPVIAAQVPRVDPKPMVVIAATAADGTPVIGQVKDADLLPDGGVVVADGASNEVLFFGADGKLGTRAGGTGAGPGEFKQLWGVEVCGGRVLGYELSVARLNRYSPKGRYLDALPLSEPLVAMTPVTCVAEGAVVGVTGLRPSPGDGAMPSLVPMDGRLVVIDSAGANRLAINVRPVLEMVMAGGGGVPRPLGPMLSYAGLGPDFLLGTGADSTIRVVHLGEQSVRVLPLPPVAATAEDRQAAEADWLELVPESFRDRAAAALKPVPTPATLPRYRDMRSSPAGPVWLLTSAPSAGAQTWTLTDGHRLLGTVALPVPGDLLAIGRDRVLILATDENGEQRLEVHGLK